MYVFIRFPTEQLHYLANEKSYGNYYGKTTRQLCLQTYNIIYFIILYLREYNYTLLCRLSTEIISIWRPLLQ